MAKAEASLQIFLDQRLNTLSNIRNTFMTALLRQRKKHLHDVLSLKKRCVRRALMARVCGADHFFMCVHSSNLHGIDKLMDLDGVERRLGHHFSFTRVCEDSDGTVTPVSGASWWLRYFTEVGETC